MSTPGASSTVRTGFVNPITAQEVGVDRGDLADAIAAAVRAVAGVEDLHTGTFGEVATYLPGRRVQGVQLGPDRCAVHLVLAWGAPVLVTADKVRAVVGPLVGTRVDITIEDVVDPARSASGDRG